MTDTIELIHNKENEMKNHIRFHYDDKLSTCRVSYLLQNKHLSELLMVKKLENDEEMKDYYDTKLKQLGAMYQKSQDIVRVQGKTVIECQVRASHLEKELKETVDEFETFKADMTEKYNKIEHNFNRKVKQEVWAHFKIMNLKKKLKKAERLLHLKNMRLKSIIDDTDELKEKLKVSLEIRSGMEKSFERRATIRGRLGILNQEIMLPDKNIRATNSKSMICQRRRSEKQRSLSDKMCQTDCNHIQVKNQAVDCSPLFTEMNNQIEQLESKIARETKIYELATKQNEALKRLISGKNLGMLFSSEYRELATKPTSLEAQTLYDLTLPKGVLLERKSSCKALTEENNLDPKQHVKCKLGINSTSIPSSNTMVGFEGLIGHIYDKNE